MNGWTWFLVSIGVTGALVFGFLLFVRYVMEEGERVHILNRPPKPPLIDSLLRLMGLRR